MMPESTSDKKKTPKAGAKVRLDFASVGGIALALLGIVGGLLLEKGSIQDIAQGTAALIVLGGTLGAVLVTSPLDLVLRAARGLGYVFFEPVSEVRATIETLIQYATKARKHGIVSLESDAEKTG